MNFLLNMLGAGGIAGIAVVLINAVVNRRKLGAETSTLSASATETITRAASGVLHESREDNKRLREENVQQESRIDVLEAEVRELKLERQESRRVLQMHAAWDALAIERVREAIPPITLPDAPPLTPPTLERLNRGDV